MNYWIFPCNIKKYDIINHFLSHDFIAWKKPYGAKIGDVVYIYLSAPYSCIRYKCTISEIDLSIDQMENYTYAIQTYAAVSPKYLLLKYEEIYNNPKLNVHSLKENGLSQLLKQVKVDEKLLQYIQTQIEIGGDN